MTDVATFKLRFPSFATRSDSEVQTWLDQAVASLDLVRLNTNADLAVYLFTAHNLSLSMRDEASATAGVTPGAPYGLLSSQGAGGLSASYDYGSTMEAGAGFYGQTSYGQRLWQLITAAALGGFFPRRQRRPGVFPGTWYVRS